MKLTKTIEINLSNPSGMQVANAVEGDSYTRQVDIRLLSDSRTPWLIPEDVDVLISYVKPDRTAGAYDTLPDGTQAYSINGSVLSVMLAPQMLTAVGMVTVQVRLTQGDKVLSTCPFGIRVARSIAPDAKSEDYINWTHQYLPQTVGAKVGQWLQITAVDAQGRVLAVEAVDGMGDTGFQAVLETQERLERQVGQLEKDVAELKDKVVEKLPEPSALYRGRPFIVTDGKNDLLYICLMVSGSYQWVKLYGEQTKKLTAPVIYLETVADPDEPNAPGDTEEITPAILGVAVLGRTILGEYGGVLPKLGAPVIRLETEEEPALTKLDTPVITLETVVMVLDAPVIKLVEV